MGSITAGPATGPFRFPLTYDECRARFRRSTQAAGLPWSAHPIAARGPHGQQLTIEAATLGAPSAARAVLVLAGVHGDEGFSSSAIMCAAVGRWSVAPPTDVRVVFVHGVNPWGMANWRRQNESNVDLNRNWDRDGRDPEPNRGYAELHHALCPDGVEPPDADSLLAVTRRLIDEHGYGWVKAAVTEGQYTHPDGLYYGGARTEESTRVVADIVTERLAGVREVLVVDLHTGHGEFGTYTLLSVAPPESADDAWIRANFDASRIENTTEPDTTSPPKRGQIALGLHDVVPTATTWRTLTFELGTVSDTRMILNERAEHWVWHHGDPADPAYADILWEHRCGSTPDDPAWEQAALAHGERTLDDALAAMGSVR
ncbi:MAG: DUF2817 domain-containing protein [Actinomycetota bacterium]